MNFRESNLNFIIHRGADGHQILEDLANLRIDVFREYPYLYEGDLEYEKKYLGRYFSAQQSYVVGVYDQGRMVGATTAILLSEEDERV